MLAERLTNSEKIVILKETPGRTSFKEVGDPQISYMTEYKMIMPEVAETRLGGGSTLSERLYEQIK